MPILVITALLAVYIVLGILYENLIHPVTIISTLPSAGVGAMLALTLFGVDLNVISIIGIVLLIGIVKKNAIMMIRSDNYLHATVGGGGRDAGPNAVRSRSQRDFHHRHRAADRNCQKERHHDDPI